MFRTVTRTKLQNMLTFRKNYFFAAVFLFLVEVFIALYIRDAVIRPYGGDFLVILLIYCLLKSFFKIPVKNAILGTLAFAFLVEGLQFIKLIKLLGLEGNSLASAILGSHFEWLDMLLYSLAALTLLGFEKMLGYFRAQRSYDSH